MTAHVIVSGGDAPDRRAVLAALFTIIVGLAFAGAVLADSALRGAGHGAGGGVPANAIGVPASTGFGSLTVQSVDTLDGLDPAVFDQGMAHGIGGLVAADQAQVQVSVFLQNASGHAVKLDPRQFQLRLDGTPTPVPVTGSTLMSMELAPRASLEATLAFVTPRGGARMSFEFQEAAQGAVLAIPVGALDQAPPSAGQHLH
jgi:hypothetical protein